jgi:hypothetical protein
MPVVMPNANSSTIPVDPGRPLNPGVPTAAAELVSAASVPLGYLIQKASEPTGWPASLALACRYAPMVGELRLVVKLTATARGQPTARHEGW